MGIIASAISSAQQASAVARQEAFQREAFQNRYQWQMQDMRKAGLNPTLAFQQGPGAAPTGAMAKPNIDVSDAPLSAARKIAEELKAVRAQRVYTEAQTEGQRIRNKIEGAQVPFKEAEEEIKRTIIQELREGYNSAKGLWEEFTGGGNEPQDPEHNSAKHEPKYPVTYEDALKSRRLREELKDEPDNQIRDDIDFKEWRQKQLDKGEHITQQKPKSSKARKRRKGMRR